MSTSIANNIDFKEDARAEKNLWVAVLGQAINDAEALATKVQDTPNLWNDPLFLANTRELINYFRSRSLKPGSFGFICDLMDVAPDQITQRIHEKYLRHLTPITKHSTTTSLSAA